MNKSDPEQVREIGRRLIKVRSALGWTQQELSEASGVAGAQICRYEAQKSFPRPGVIAKLAKAMAIRYEWLAWGEKPIEDGSLVPKDPSIKKGVSPADMNDGLREAVEAFAEARGIDYEMAFGTLARLVIDRAWGLVTEHQSGASPSPEPNAWTPRNRSVARGTA